MVSIFRTDRHLQLTVRLTKLFVQTQNVHLIITPGQYKRLMFTDRHPYRKSSIKPTPSPGGGGGLSYFKYSSMLKRGEGLVEMRGLIEGGLLNLVKLTK